LRKSASYWVALCLENGLVAQENTKEGAIDKLKEAMDSFQIVYQSEENIYNSPVSIKDIHEFLMVEGKEPISEIFELRAVYS
jgi:hypothetical protein